MCNWRMVLLLLVCSMNWYCVPQTINAAAVKLPQQAWFMGEYNTDTNLSVAGQFSISLSTSDLCYWFQLAVHTSMIKSDGASAVLAGCRHLHELDILIINRNFLKLMFCGGIHYRLTSLSRWFSHFCQLPDCLHPDGDIKRSNVHRSLCF